MELEKELQELVSKHLPQATGDALRQRLDQADKDAALVISHQTTIGQLKSEMSNMVETINELNSLKSRIDHLDKAEKDLASNQRKLEIEKLQYQLDSEKEKQKWP